MAKSALMVMRTLHRNIGFLVMGMTIIFALSGVTMVFRNAGFLQTEKTEVKQLPQGMQGSAVVDMLHQKDMKVVNETATTVTFNNGTYDKTTGNASYKSKTAIFPMNKFMSLHKSRGQNLVGWLVSVYGLCLLFLAISSLWMFKPATKQFKKGMVLCSAGVIITIVLLIFA